MTSWTSLLMSVLQNEWNDHTITNTPDAEEQQRRDIEFFQPFPDPIVAKVVNEKEGDDDDEEEEEEDPYEKEIDNMKYSMAGFNNNNPLEDAVSSDGESESEDGSDSSEESSYSSEESSDSDENTNQIIPHLRTDIEEYLRITFEEFKCCDGRCFNQFDRATLSESLRKFAKLNETERRKLLHISLAFSVRVNDAKNEKRRRLNVRKRTIDALTTPPDSETDPPPDAAPALNEGDRTRTSYQIALLGHPICRKALCRVFGVGNTMCSAVQKSISHNNILVRESRRGLHSRGYKHERTTAFKTFLDSYAHDKGHPCPTGRGAKRDKPVIYLPCTLTKIILYRDHYLPAMREQGILAVTYNFFCRTWKKKIPMIKIRRPKTDTCDTCLKHRSKGEFEEMETHLLRADCQRKAFNASTLNSRELENFHSVQFTFDYAEKVLLPRFSNTPKSIYYKVGLKMDLFGIANNTNQVQDNYALPEGHWPADKGINSLASMLYHNLNNHHLDKTTLMFMADNCGGQNKNCFMMWWLSYMSFACAGFADIELRFLVAGHTKNFCDACFGLCKRSLKGKDVFSPKTVRQFYADSASCNRVANVSEVVWYDWKSFLGQFYDGKVKHLKRYHEFKFSRKEPGVVSSREYADSRAWIKTSLFRRGVDPTVMYAPAGDFKPLSDFIVDPATYSLANHQIVKKDGTSHTRLDYLLEEIVGDFLIGEHTPHADIFFENGETSGDQLV